ncbi:MAG: C39 family peptidase [Bacillota bacterium]|nr:C39 family peptidase [Bacillota bacterium]
MKKFLLIVLIAIFIMNLGLVSFASGVQGELTVEEGADVYITPQEELDLYAEMEAKLKLENLRSFPDGKYKTLSIPVFEQEENYYCGPATIKQVVHFLNSSSDNQNTIANEMGTTCNGTNMLEIRNYLNNNTSENYTYRGEVTNYYYTWLNFITTDIDIDKPVILEIDTTNIDSWPYVTEGHYVNVSGYDTKYSYGEIRITDPWGPGLGNRWYTMEDVHQANDQHWRKAIIE